MQGPKALPREVSPGVWWLGQCLEQRERNKLYHSYNAAFLIIGETASMLCETGHPKDFPAIESQMKSVLARGAPPLKYLFLTHQETPHSGGLGRVLDRYPDLTIHGEMSDYHLAFPEHAHRMHWMNLGDELDLGGGIKFRTVESIVRDLRTTLWGFLTKGNVLFPGDGFAYSHYHEDGHCGLFAEEATSLDLQDTSAVFAERALFWTKFVDMSIYTEKLDELFAELDVKTICPAHGLPVTDVVKTVPKVKEGLLFGSAAPSSRDPIAAPSSTAAEIASVS
jgi:flavorubredoxin